MVSLPGISVAVQTIRFTRFNGDFQRIRSIRTILLMWTQTVRMIFWSRAKPTDGDIFTHFEVQIILYLHCNGVCRAIRSKLEIMTLTGKRILRQSEKSIIN